MPVGGFGVALHPIPAAERSPLRSETCLFLEVVGEPVYDGVSLPTLIVERATDVGDSPCPLLFKVQLRERLEKPRVFETLHYDGLCHDLVAVFHRLDEHGERVCESRGQAVVDGLGVGLECPLLRMGGLAPAGQPQDVLDRGLFHEFTMDPEVRVVGTTAVNDGLGSRKEVHCIEGQVLIRACLDGLDDISSCLGIHSTGERAQVVDQFLQFRPHRAVQRLPAERLHRSVHFRSRHAVGSVAELLEDRAGVVDYHAAVHGVGVPLRVVATCSGLVERLF